MRAQNIVLPFAFFLLIGLMIVATAALARSQAAGTPTPPAGSRDPSGEAVP